MTINTEQTIRDPEVKSNIKLAKEILAYFDEKGFKNRAETSK